MAISISRNLNISGNAGSSIQASVTRTGDGGIVADVTLPAGKAGTLSTRTDDNTGTATLSVSHGILDGMIVDVYWTSGVRYGMTVGTVSGTSVPLDGGAGDNLPAQSTAIVVTPQVQVNLAIDGDELAYLAACLQYAAATTPRGHMHFQDADSDSIAAVELSNAADTLNALSDWDIDGGASNIFTGDPITKVMCSNGNSSLAATLYFRGVQDATP